MESKNELLPSESEYDEELSNFEDGWSDNEDEYPTLSNPQSDYKQEKSYLSTKENKERGNDEQKETRDKLQENRLLEDSLTDIKTNDSCYLSPTHTDYHESQVNSEESKKSSASIAQKNLTPFENLLKEIRDRPKQNNKGFKEVNFVNKQKQNQDDSELQEKHGLKTADQKEMSEETKKRLREIGLLKIV